MPGSRIELRHVRYVIAAAEHGSFRGAAAALGVQESAISRRIRDLEVWLGTVLFVRTHSGVHLTDAGKQFVKRGRKAMSHIRLARSEATAIGQGADGQVRIGILSSLASGFLSDLIQAFGARYRGVQMTFIDGNPTQHVAAVRQHQLDVTFVIGASRWRGCRSQHFWSERVFAVLPTNHPHADDDEVHFADLAGESFIFSESAPGEEMYDYLVQRFADLGHQPDIHQQGVGRDNLMRLVALGRGLTVTSEATTAARFPGVIFRPIVGEVLPFSAVWSPQNLNPALHRLLDLAHSMAGLTRKEAISGPPCETRQHVLPSQSRDLSP